MKIVDDVKLDFSDVLIKPKRSTLFSRKDVKLERSFLFLNSKQEWSGIPIVASNMDTIGTKRMAKVFTENSLMTCLHKFHEEEDYEEIYSYENAENHCILTIGMRDGDFEKGKRVVENNPHLKFICIDVANGYSQQFLRYVERARKRMDKQDIDCGQYSDTRNDRSPAARGCGYHQGWYRKRVMLHNTQDGWSGLSSTVGNNGVRRRRSWSGRSYHGGWWVYLSR